MIKPYIDCLQLEKQSCIYSERFIVDDDDNTAIGEKHSIIQFK
jgi:hypothetical protein